MKQLLIILIIMFGAILLADWDVGDPHIMHFPQLPDNCGTDIYNEGHWCDSAEPLNCTAIADDWVYLANGPVTDFHVWYSWNEDQIGIIYEATLEIYSDIPADPNNQIPYSKPGQLLWRRTIPVDPTMLRGTTYNSLQSFAWLIDQQPGTPFTLVPNTHWYTHQINIEFPLNDPDLFIPQMYGYGFGDIFWFSISFQVQFDPDYNYEVGWKTADWELYPDILPTDPLYPRMNYTDQVFNDAAVYKFIHPDYTWDWYPILLHGENPDYLYRDLAFVITGEDDPLPVELSSFTGIFNSELCSSTLNWTTQTESQNMGWYVYRGESNNPDEAMMLNGQMIQGAGTCAEPTYYQYDDVSDLEFDSNYWYWIESVSSDGNQELMGPIVVQTMSEEFNPDAPDLADQYGLLQNYPNPFNPVTYFQFKLPEDCVGTLEVYDIKGRKVATVFEDQSLEKDSVDPIRWVAEDNNGNALNSGIYFYKLKTNADVFTKKMIIIK